ncbi:hypothetical protein [Kingella potus]|uniref:hypothetical protein n=1 Tax=Kingella potus TaxID=265175 RepID=UPI000E1B6615|nr:hypothetical protein [Kingella potus]UOP00161.1 hypothetical protein LVJ84_09430 [Kingella potus]
MMPLRIRAFRRPNASLSRPTLCLQKPRAWQSHTPYLSGRGRLKTQPRRKSTPSPAFTRGRAGEGVAVCRTALSAFLQMSA